MAHESASDGHDRVVRVAHLGHLRGVKGLQVALPHKILHRKRPWLFPILDRKTSKFLGAGEAWVTIPRDLVNHAGEFEHLERWFVDLAPKYCGIALTRLRIHDILVWRFAVS